jgi:hypothetical protein
MQAWCFGSKAMNTPRPKNWDWHLISLLPWVGCFDWNLSSTTMNKMILKAILALPIICAPYFSTAQCGTVLEAADTSWIYQLPWVGNNAILLEFLQQGGEETFRTNNLATSPCGGTTAASHRIPVQAHILFNTDSTGGFEPFLIDSVIRLVNGIHILNNTGIQFYLVCEPQRFYNTELAQEIDEKPDTDQLFSLFDSEAAVDVFFIDTALFDAFGLARYPNAAHPFHTWVITDRAAIADIAETLTHEFGHCFNLFHTGDGIRCGSGFNATCNACKQEAVSRSRGQGLFCTPIGQLKCELNGDFLCDTPADPGLSRGDNLQNCMLTPSTSGDIDDEDHWGDTWLPMVENIMSYATNCRTTFTTMQEAVMVGTINTYIPNYAATTLNDFDVFEPNNHARSGTILQNGDVQCHTFHWTPLNASEFRPCDVDWFRFGLANPGMVSVKTSEVLYQPQPDTYLELFDANMSLIASNDSLNGSDFAWIRHLNLAAGNYFVRVTNLSSYPSDASRGHYTISLTTGPLLDAGLEIVPAIQMQISPQPSNGEIQLYLAAGQPGNYEISVRDAKGVCQRRLVHSMAPGDRLAMDLTSLPKGLYFLEVRLKDKTSRTKIVLQ